MDKNFDFYGDEERRLAQEKAQGRKGLEVHRAESPQKPQNRSGRVVDLTGLTDRLPSNPAKEELNTPREEGVENTGPGEEDIEPVAPLEEGSERYLRKLDEGMDTLVLSLKQIWDSINDVEKDTESPEFFINKIVEVKSLFLEALIPYAEQVNHVVNEIMEYYFKEIKQ